MLLWLYDRTTDIAVTGNGTVSGVIGGDAVNLTLAAAYNDGNVGTGKAVTGTYGLSGADATNYTLASNAFSTTADITARALTITANNATKTAQRHQEALGHAFMLAKMVQVGREGKRQQPYAIGQRPQIAPILADREAIEFGGKQQTLIGGKFLIGFGFAAGQPASRERKVGTDLADLGREPLIDVRRHGRDQHRVTQQARQRLEAFIVLRGISGGAGGDLVGRDRRHFRVVDLAGGGFGAHAVPSELSSSSVAWVSAIVVSTWRMVSGSAGAPMR